MTGAEFDLPVPVVLERGDVVTLIGQRDVKPDNVPPGLVLCPTCSTEQSPREGGRLAVHYPTRDALRPCAGSWPANVVQR